MVYSEGYVAFIDILGFKNLILDEKNFSTVHKIIDSIYNISALFDAHPDWNCKIAFFSDSVVMTSTSGYHNFLLPIRILEDILQTETGLLYRGGIAKGKFFHDKKTAFGPAVITAYQLENAASEARILVNVGEEVLDNFFFFKDFDGEYCINPYAVRLTDDFEYDTKSGDSAGTLNEVFSSLSRMRCELQEKILSLQYDEEKINSTVLRKYLWRIIPFNYICDYIVKHMDEIDGLQLNDAESDQKAIEAIQKLKFQMGDTIMGYADV